MENKLDLILKRLDDLDARLASIEPLERVASQMLNHLWILEKIGTLMKKTVSIEDEKALPLEDEKGRANAGRAT